MSRFGRFIEWWERWERYIGLGGLVVGFTFDLFLAKRPDSIPDNILLLCYLFIAGAIIVLLNMRQLRRTLDQSPAEPLLLLLILQFCFGGLASNMLVLYGKSGTLAESLLFVGLLAAFAFGNEFLRSRYAQLRLNIAIYYFLLLTYCIIAVPTFILHTIGDRAFLISEMVSVVAIAVFLSVIFFAVIRNLPARVDRRKQLLNATLPVVVIFLVFTGLYFLNIIPPVPLSLKEIGIYHTLKVNAPGNYTVTYEPSAWWAFWRDTSATYNAEPGQPAYCFSSVYAPGNLTTPIYHRWEYFYPTTGHWITVGLVGFPITGGRAQGYNGYSEKMKLTPGDWRCDVETGSGQLIGRITFTIVEGSSTPTLSTTTL